MSISRFDVLRVYVVSKERETAIGIRLRNRPNLLITTIKEVSGHTSDDTCITVRETSIYGEAIERKSIPIRDIESISNLRISFDDPFYVYLRSLRENIRFIRKEVGLGQGQAS